ncbi:unnamed protein product [Rotaria magnacalcarata]|uniref:Uncharacterized protein n=3 Tax=Rotaria magnacalcarata TaxID=392030 RepID=A0A8S2M4J7_9BILA|nr:unnamed protein product [Rotaria magnacalcarata]
MSKHTTGSMTPGRVRKISAGLSNARRAFDDDIDDFEIDENDFDGNFPMIHNAPFHSQQRPSSVHQSNYNKNTSPTPAHLMKRLINELFTKEEMMAVNMKKPMNEQKKSKVRTVKLYFFQNDDIQVASFGDYEGKFIRENQRRGTIFRNKLFAEDDA